jgi:hypothetical protein
MAVAGVDLVTDENAAPAIARSSADETEEEELAQYMEWAERYVRVGIFLLNKPFFFFHFTFVSNGGDGESPELISRFWFQVLFTQAPDYKQCIQAGRDARRVWFALRDWRGDDLERYFGCLGAWAERLMKELDLA